MDLTKLLNNRQSHPQLTLADQGTIFFSLLITQLETDLKYLCTQFQSNQQNFFKKIRVLHGNIDENIKKLTRDVENEKNYLFLQLPFVPGFLIESEKNSEFYKMFRATKVNPILNSETGESIRPEIFVLKSKELEEFRVLDDCFVRTTTSDRTLSVKQMSEMLLLLAESVREEI